MMPSYPSDVGPGDPSAMTERSPAMVVVLGIVTCGIYTLIWYYQTTEELRIATGDDSIKPGLDIVLTFVTCGIWWVYTDYRNAKKVYELSQRMGLGRSDQAMVVLLVDLFATVVTPALLQAEYNEIARASGGRRA